MRQHIGFIGSLWILLFLGLPPLVATAVGPAEPPAQPPAKALPELQSRVQALMTEARIPGAGIVLIREGQPVWIGGIGKADIASGRAVDADTHFRIGSITKSFLAIALMQQVERGHLSLEDKLSDIAPEIPIDNPWNATDPVRVKHVLEHTAGFDDMRVRHILPDPKAHNHLIKWGDTLRNPRLLDSNDHLLHFDVVVANPPFSLEKWGYDSAEKDRHGRFRRGLPPKTKGDYAFILHMIETLSCSPNGVIALNPALVKAPSDCIDYVLLHELCHLKHHNHSPQFYRLMDRQMPQWLSTKSRLDEMAEQLLPTFHETSAQTS